MGVGDSKAERTVKFWHAVVGIISTIILTYFAIVGAASVGHQVPGVGQVETVTVVSTSTTTVSEGIITVTKVSSALTRTIVLTEANSSNSLNAGTLRVANVTGYLKLVIYPPDNSPSNAYIYFSTSETGSYSLANGCTGGANPGQCVGVPGQSITVPEGEGLWIGIGLIPANRNVTIIETL